MERIKAAIIGASGYTGQELARLLLAHPHIELIAVTSRRYEGLPLTRLYPALAGATELIFSKEAPEALAGKADVLFLALPHQVSQNIMGVLAESGKKIVDLSADFRLADAAVYERWYGEHTQKELLGRFVYGLPELFRGEIRVKSFIANPGCYPTSVLLGLAPALGKGLIKADTIIIDSCSGVSGAGREPQVDTLFCEVAQGFKAYKVGGRHRHIPEIEQGLARLAGVEEITVSFTPHLLPVNRGILSTIYASLVEEQGEQELHSLYRDFYKDEPFVRVCPLGSLPNISAVAGSNYCDIAVAVDKRTGRLIVISAIDNLIKGAAGQAIQNMNIICGLPETTGLQANSIFP